MKSIFLPLSAIPVPEFEQLLRIVEGALLSSPEPLSLEQLAKLFESGEKVQPSDLERVLKILLEECRNHAYELKKTASGYRFQVREIYAPWINRLEAQRPVRFSRALLEILVLIAYKQPITRGQIEAVRGVRVNNTIMRNLLDREWIQAVGKLQLPGQPTLYGTTPRFLNDLGLTDIDELPPLPEFRQLSEAVVTGIEASPTEPVSTAAGDSDQQ